MAEETHQPTNNEAELKYLLKFKILESITSILKTFISFAGVVLVALFTYYSIAVYSINNAKVNLAVGEVNVVKNLFSIDFLKSPSSLMTLAGVIFGFSGIVYGKKQRALRMSTVEKLQGRITELEKVRDSKRSSSMLTPKGETRPEDN